MKVGKFTLEGGKYCWILSEITDKPQKTKKGEIKKDKDGNIEYIKYESFHATIRQAVDYLIDRKCGQTKDLQELKDMLRFAADHTEDFLKDTMEEK